MLQEPDVLAIADAHGARPAQVAVAWLLAASPAMLPIPGTASRDHLQENVAAGAQTLTPEELSRLDR